MESFNSIKTLVESTQADIEKAEGGNKQAIMRVRKAIQQVKVLCKTVRDEAQAFKTVKETK